MEEITQQDRNRIKKIKFRRSNNNKYFSYFDTKEEAYLCLKEVASRYRYSGLHTNTISDLCQEYQDKGIMLYPTQLGRWFKDVFNLTVRYTGYGNTKPLNKVTTSMYLDKHLKENYLDLLVNDREITESKRSWYINTILMKHCGMPTDEVLVFFEGRRLDQESKHMNTQQVSILFFEDRDEVQALYFGKLDNQSKKVIELLCQIGEDEGLDALKARAERLGYYAL